MSHTIKISLLPVSKHTFWYFSLYPEKPAFASISYVYLWSQSLCHIGIFTWDFQHLPYFRHLLPLRPLSLTPTHNEYGFNWRTKFAMLHVCDTYICLSHAHNAWLIVCTSWSCKMLHCHVYEILCNHFQMELFPSTKFRAVLKFWKNKTSIHTQH